MKKTISLALALIMALTSVFCVSFSAFAAETLVLDTPKKITVADSETPEILEFTPSEDGTYIFYSSDRDDDADPFVKLYSDYDLGEDDRVYVGADDDTAGNLNFFVRAQLEKDVKYTIVCRVYDGVNSEYSVTVKKSNIVDFDFEFADPSSLVISESSFVDKYPDGTLVFDAPSIFADGNKITVYYDNDTSAEFEYREVADVYDFYDKDDNKADFIISYEKCLPGSASASSNYMIIACDGIQFDYSVTIKHNLTKVPAKAATETATGNNEYYVCSACKKCFKDAAGTKETTVAAETLAKLTPAPAPAPAAPAATPATPVTKVTLKKVAVKKSAKKLV
ncbi:MAG: hypothetical protein IKF64_05145, partial [Eubacterium sp.]|nr:hypothetical protein [Eubacterium sp.]